MSFDTEDLNLKVIGSISSPYEEKFAIPRQPGLVTAAKSSIVFSKQFNREELLRGLDEFSHIWIVFLFHEAIRDQWKPMVRPPRLGGNQKVGVFASRSPFRPNPIGLSVVKKNQITNINGQWRIEFEGGDLLNQTPVIDVKPYVPYADAIPEAQAAYAEEAPAADTKVIFLPMAQSQLDDHRKYPELQQLIEQVLAQQPQPAYKKMRSESYGMTLYDLNIRWHIAEDVIYVESVQSLEA